MAARRMMERETVLNLNAIQKLFNPFFRTGHKLFNDMLSDWIVHPDATKRLFGVTQDGFLALTTTPGNQRHAVLADGWERMRERYRDVFQRRHDCIHNCDRPKVSPQPLNRSGTVLKVIQDVEFLVYRCDEHIQAEFHEFLQSTGCNAATMKQVGY